MHRPEDSSYTDSIHPDGQMNCPRAAVPVLITLLVGSAACAIEQLGAALFRWIGRTKSEFHEVFPHLDRPESLALFRGV